MDQVEGTFKLVYRGTDGYDLLFSRTDGFGGLDERRAVSSLAGAIDVLERVLGRQLTDGEKETLALGNGVVASVSSANFNTYF